MVDSGASMHMLSKKDLNSAELETVQVSKKTSNGYHSQWKEVQTNEEATVHVNELDLFLTVKFFEDTPAVPSLRKPCEEHGYFYVWTGGQLPHLVENGGSENVHLNTRAA